MLAVAIVALVIWVAILSSRLKRVTDALMAHPELEHPVTHAVAEESVDEVADTTAPSVAYDDACAGPGNPAANRGMGDGNAAGTATFDATRVAEAQAAAIAEMQAAEAQAHALAELQQAQAAAAAEAQQQYAAQQAAAQQAAYAQAAYAQQAGAGYPSTAQQAYAAQQPLAPGATPQDAAQQQAMNAARAQGMQQNAMATQAAQQAALAQQHVNAHHPTAAANASRATLAQNVNTFLEQRQTRDEGYSFEEGASDFFDGYRSDAERQEKSFGRSTPLIPLGADRDVVEKRESYAEGALGGEYDLDSIDFSKVAGYRHPKR